MSEKYQRPDYIRVVKAVCVEFGNNDDTWTWCYLDVREALTKANSETMMTPGHGAISMCVRRLRKPRSF